VDSWRICTPYVRTGEQLADVLTKGGFSSVSPYKLLQFGHARYLCFSLRESVVFFFFFFYK